MDEPSTWYGVIALLITTVGGIMTARGGRIRRQEVPVAEPEPAELVGADLTTLAGIATVVSRQSLKLTAQEQRIHQLEAEQAATRDQIAALVRYNRLLQGTIRRAGGVVPEPDPSDRPLIDQ
ncbi:hypothetical protein ACFXKG_18600 [Streptomyces sp. NPDC059255]|uniref:hypothetical protein n=1 Tax=Streptomyces sp. NPDC059255 TaxID=3346793 RepID=UPI0036CE9048